jgi:hypothetical protein
MNNRWLLWVFRRKPESSGHESAARQAVGHRKISRTPHLAGAAFIGALTQTFTES